MVRHQFEKSWSNAFADTEIVPDESVWTKIELGLVQAERRQIKKSVVFYQRLAASLALLIIAGAGAYYFVDQAETAPSLVNSTQQENTVKTPSGLTPDPANTTENDSSDDGKVAVETPVELKTSASNGLSETLGLHDGLETNQTILAANKNDKLESNEPAYRQVHPLTELTAEDLAVLIKSKMREIELVRRLPAMPAEYMNSTRNKNADSKVWASLGASTGTYNPNAGSLSSVAEANADASSPKAAVYSQPSSGGTAFSFGMSAGKKIAERWVLQTGFNYFNQSLNYTSNVASLSPSNRASAYSSQFDAGLSSGYFALTSPYTVNNSIELFSVPIQAGYMVVNRKVGVQVNTGISTDFFVRSTLVDESGQFDKFTQSAGDDSPIRPINWSGLFSTEMSYRIGDHYGVAVVPGMRYSFAPLSKPGEGSIGNVLIWDIGFRLRYHFK